MKKRHEDREPEPQEREYPGPHPGNGTGPVYFKPRRRPRSPGLREHGAYAPVRDWPLVLTEPDPAEAMVQHHLEQVGAILRRLDLDMAEITRMRAETRARLARLAA
jgi:hypothetical protein